MKIKLVENKEEWDGWLKQNSEHAPFSESWEWGEVLIAEGKKVERLAVVEGSDILAQAQVAYSDLPFGWRYGFTPKGPIVKYHVSSIMYQVCDLLGDYLKEKNCIFFRTEPAPLIHNTKYIIHNTFDVNPRTTTILDLTQSEDELLSAMHEKTRYNIRLSERKGLVISHKKDFEVLIKLLRETGKRNEFRLHAKKHYKQILDSTMSYQLSAVLGGRALATIILVGFGNTFTYLYGASDYERRQLMASYLLQWEAIKLGKKLGYKWYDFFGIAPSDSRKSKVKSLKSEYLYDVSHQYAGVTRFKLGFGGDILEDPGTFDLIISPLKYRIYGILRKIRRLF